MVGGEATELVEEVPLPIRRHPQEHLVEDDRKRVTCRARPRRSREVPMEPLLQIGDEARIDNEVAAA